jgi:hypothetical protein
MGENVPVPILLERWLTLAYKIEHQRGQKAEKGLERRGGENEPYRASEASARTISSHHRKLV